MFRLFPLSIGVLLVARSLAQPGATEQMDRSFLTIMVIPYTGPGDTSKQAAIERNELCRHLLGQINQIFGERGYRTKDYLAVLKQSAVAPDVHELERTEIKEAIRNAKVDVVVHVEIKWSTYPPGDKQLQLRLQAIDPFSAEHYAENIAIESTRRFYQEPTQACREAQLIRQLQGFADQLDRKLADVLQNGRTVTVRVKALPSSKVKLGSLMDGGNSDLAAFLDEWLRQRCKRLYPAASDNEVWEAECKIPVVDSSGRSVTPFSLRSDLKSMLLQLRFGEVPPKIREAAVINSVIEILLE